MAGRKKSIWTPELVDKLLKLWEEGLSAAQIARELGNGLSRNAVIGKVHRLRNAGKAPARREGAQERSATPTARKAPQRPAPQAAETTTATTAPQTPLSDGNLALKAEKKAEPKAEEKRAVSVAASNTGLVRDIMELTHKSCRWPIGDPGDEDFCYCGRTAKDGLPYCEEHAAVAYQGPQERRRAAG